MVLVNCNNSLLCCFDRSIGYFATGGLSSGAVSQTACSVGSYSAGSVTVCTSVSPGYEATGQLTSAAISQTICGTGKYSAGSVAACSSVSAGKQIKVFFRLEIGMDC